MQNIGDFFAGKFDRSVGFTLTFYSFNDHKLAKDNAKELKWHSCPLK